MAETISTSLSARRTKKSDETRNRILQAALDLFREHGFEATTMRDIARESDVALGATYYHFESKEAIVLAFYEVAKENLQDPLETALLRASGLADGVRALIEAKLDYFAPNKKFLGALFPHCADPRDPLSIFSPENRHIRQADIQFFTRLLAESNTKVPADLKEYVPSLLWLYQLAILLFWIYDRTENHSRTSLVIDKSLRIVTTLLDLSRLPFTQPVRQMVIDFFDVIASHH